jgi:hypothetical protein
VSPSFKDALRIFSTWSLKSRALLDWVFLFADLGPVFSCVTARFRSAVDPTLSFDLADLFRRFAGSGVSGAGPAANGDSSCKSISFINTVTG